MAEYLRMKKAHRHTQTHRDKHKHTQTHINTHRHKQTHTQINIYIYTHTHTHTHKAGVTKSVFFLEYKKNTPKEINAIFSILLRLFLT